MEQTTSSSFKFDLTKLEELISENTRKDNQDKETEQKLFCTMVKVFDIMRQDFEMIQKDLSSLKQDMQGNVKAIENLTRDINKMNVCSEFLESNINNI